MQNKKGNFGQALRELTGFGSVDESPQASFDSYSPANVDVKVNASEFNFKEKAAQVTKITSSMIISGNIETNDNMQIFGKVVGDINTTSEVSLPTAKIKGNIKSAGTVVIGMEATLIGNISANEVKSAGKVRGNIDSATSLQLAQSSLVDGSVSAENIIMAEGAQIKGNIRTKVSLSDSDLDKVFDFGGEFDE